VSSHPRQRPEPRTPGRPAEWSREQIVRAALAIAEADGLAATTTRRVAARLGTGSASLYRHVANRAALIDLMVDAALDEYEPPVPTGDWRADLVAEHMQRVRYLRSRPWLVDASIERPPIGPAALRVLEHFLELLRDHPAPGRAKMEAFGVLAGLIQTYLRNERPGGGVLDPEFVEAQTAALVRAATDGTHPRLAEVFADLTAQAAQAPEPADDQLARVVGLMLDGLLQPTRPDRDARRRTRRTRDPGR
jgi:AcrR family transcriptional regulator